MAETIEEASRRVLLKALEEQLLNRMEAGLIEGLKGETKYQHIMDRHVAMAEFISAEIMKTRPDVIGIMKAATAIISESTALKTLGSSIICL